MDIESAARQLEALGNPTRLKVYRELARSDHSGLSVGVLQQRVGIPASTLSHHLQRLMQAGLAVQERQATTLICRAVHPAMRSLVDFLAEGCGTE
ncbi:ArsR/SmtB family transcription factor [Methylobacterium sp. C33D]